MMTTPDQVWNRHWPRTSPKYSVSRVRTIIFLCFLRMFFVCFPFLEIVSGTVRVFLCSWYLQRFSFIIFCHLQRAIASNLDHPLYLLFCLCLYWMGPFWRQVWIMIWWYFPGPRVNDHRSHPNLFFFPHQLSTYYAVATLCHLKPAPYQYWGELSWLCATWQRMNRCLDPQMVFARIATRERQLQVTKDRLKSRTACHPIVLAPCSRDSPTWFQSYLLSFTWLWQIPDLPTWILQNY